MMTELIMFVMLGLLSAWEEIIELVRDKSWSKEWFYSFLFWGTKPSQILDKKGTKLFFLKRWNALKKLLDAKHVSFGLFILVMLIFPQHGYQVIALNALGDFKDIALILIHWWLRSEE